MLGALGSYPIYKITVRWVLLHFLEEGGKEPHRSPGISTMSHRAFGFEAPRGLISGTP